MTYIAPRDADKVRARRAAAYGHAANTVAENNRKAAENLAKMAKVAKAGK